MARPSRPSRGRGRREEEAAAAGQPPLMTTQDMTALNFAEPQRGARGARRGGGGGGSRGGSPFLGLVLPLAVAFAAAVVTAVAGFTMVGPARQAAEGAIDETAAAAAMALATTEPEWWEARHGIQKDVYALMVERRDAVIQKMEKDQENYGEADIIAKKTEFDGVMQAWGIEASGQSADIERRTVEANQQRLSAALKVPGSTVLWIGIIRPSGDTVYNSAGAQPKVLGAAPARTIGAATVVPMKVALADGRILDARQADAPMKDKFGQPGGKVRIIVSAMSAAAASGLGTMAIIMALVSLLVVGGVAFGLCYGVSRGLTTLARDIDQIAQGDLDVRISAKGGGEVASLARTVDRAMKTFRAVQEQSIAAAAAQPAIVHTDAVDTGSLLPAEPMRVEGYEIEAVHKPCPAKRNDFYDYIKVDDERVGIVIAEMPQPGPKGAFVAATFRALLRAYAAGDPSPASVLAKVNRIMANELKRGDHIAAMYVILEPGKAIVSVASAGHLPLIFWKLAKKASALLNPEGIAIGLDKGPVFEKTVVDKRIKIEKGDRLVLHSDGPLAAKNMEGEEYGEQRFYYLVNREAPKNSAAFVNFVANEVDLFHGGAMQEDDISIVTLRKLSD